MSGCEAMEELVLLEEWLWRLVSDEVVVEEEEEEGEGVVAGGVVAMVVVVEMAMAEDGLEGGWSILRLLLLLTLSL